jgi:hypothetical protein
LNKQVGNALAAAPPAAVAKLKAVIYNRRKARRDPAAVAVETLRLVTIASRLPRAYTLNLPAALLIALVKDEPVAVRLAPLVAATSGPFTVAVLCRVQPVTTYAAPAPEAE